MFLNNINRIKKSIRKVVEYIKKHKILLIVIITAFLLHMLVIIPSGSYYCYQDKCGLFFWGVHGHDGIWHIALVNSAFNSIPFLIPTYGGALLSGYNALLDYIIFLVSKIGINPLFLYFKILPLIWFFVFLYIAIIFARKIKNSHIFTLFFLFFIFFGSSFGYLITLFKNGNIWQSGGLFSMQAIQTLTNLQFAYSLIFLLVILLLIMRKTINIKNIFILSILVFIQFGLKFYAGIISSFLVGLYCLNLFLKQKYRLGFYQLVSLVLFGLLSIFLFYDPISSLQSGSTFIFKPFALVYPVIEDPSLFYLKNITNARYYLIEQNKLSPRLIAIEAFSLLLFLFFNFGTRILGFIYLIFKSVKKKVEEIEVYVFLTILFSVFLTIFFIQKGEWWNTIQFFYYALFLSNIFISKLLYELIKSKKIIGIITSLIIIIATIPVNIDILKSFVKFPSQYYISKDEINILNKLKDQPQGIVLTQLYDKKAYYNEKTLPSSFSLYDDTSYIPAFSGKQVYLADLMQLRILGIDYGDRLESVEKGDCGILKDVKYVYYIKKQKTRLFKKCLKAWSPKLKKIYENKFAILYLNIK